MPSTISEALQAAEKSLSRTSPSPHLDAEVLLSHALGRPRSFLYTWPERSLTGEEQDRFRDLIDRRAEGEPIAYLTGEREFWSQAIGVTPGVLIPRPETELLVELALEHLPHGRAARIADLGTGSGAVALALARECPGCRITATDASATALSLARENAERLGLGGIDWRLGSWMEPLAGPRFDLIVSNPPYVASGDPHLERGDVRFEPREALDAGPEGLDDLRRIVEGAPDRLLSGGWLILEHGSDQGEAMRAMLSKAGFKDVETRRDLAGLERATLGRLGASRLPRSKHA